MSTLIVHECQPEVFQEIVPSNNILLKAIRPHLYIHNSPAGTIQIRITDTNGKEIYATGTSTIASLKSQIEAVVGANDFIHAWPQIEVKAGLRKNETYRIYVTCGGGYSFAESAYVGVCKDWDNTKITSTYSPSTEFNAPIDFELWERKNI